MKYTVDKTAGQPAYMQLYLQLRDDLTSGYYEYGARLPSKRLLAEETGTSVITVEHAYAILCDEGYAEAAPRSGYYSIYQAGDFSVVGDPGKELGVRSEELGVVVSLRDGSVRAPARGPAPDAVGREVSEAHPRRVILSEAKDLISSDIMPSDIMPSGNSSSRPQAPDSVGEGLGPPVINPAPDSVGEGLGPPVNRSAPDLSSLSQRSELFPFSVMAKAARRIISDYGEGLLTRSPGRGLPELRAALSAYLGRSCGIDVPPEQIVVGSGAEYLYSLIVQLLGRERPYALEDPSYEKIRRVYEANGAAIELIPLRADGLDSAALAATDAGVLHVTPFNSFPAGVTATASKRREYLARARELGAVIIEDNYESELTVSRKNEDTLYSLSGGEGVIYLNTFSRTVAPSIRVGYMVLPESLLPAFDARLGFYSCTVPPFEQYLLARLIESGDFERHVNRVRRARRNAGR